MSLRSTADDRGPSFEGGLRERPRVGSKACLLHLATGVIIMEVL